MIDNYITEIPEDYRADYKFMMGKQLENSILCEMVQLDHSDTKAIRKFLKENEIACFDFMYSAFVVLLHKYFSDGEIILSTATEEMKHFYIRKIMINEQWKIVELIKNHLSKEDNNLIFPNNKNEETRYLVSDFICIDNDKESIEIVKKYGNVVLSVLSNEETISVQATYDSTYIGKNVLVQLLKCYKNIIKQFVYNPASKISEVSALTTEEKRELLKDNTTDMSDFNPSLCIHRVFEDVVLKYPDKTALKYQGKEVSYAELNAMSNRVAKRLLEAGVHKEVTVCICISHSIELVVANLAVLKAGGICVNIDDDYPLNRKQMLADVSKAPVLLTQSSLKNEVETLCEKIILVDEVIKGSEEQDKENLPETCDGSNTAFIFYTSGTTGNPKGVKHIHSQRGGRLIWELDYFSLNQNDVHMLKTSISAGVFAKELLWPLLSGATMVIALAEKRKDIKYIVNEIDENDITVLTCVPTMLRLFYLQSKFDRLTSLKKMVCSGELLDEKTAADLFVHKKDVEFYVAYGMNEMSTATIQKVDEKNAHNLSIGKPAGICVYILNANKEIVPVGIPGEIFVSSYGLSGGYYQRDDLTNVKFVPNNIDTCQKLMYGTGDVGYYQEDGTIQYVGRLDNQVKINGYRVEINEIAGVMCECDGVKDVIIKIIKNKLGQNELVAYVESDKDSEMIEEVVRKHCKSKLPSYINPIIMVIPEIPRTGTSKVDYSKLPEPIRMTKQETSEENSAMNETEKKVCEIWKDVLEVSTVSKSDSFASLGGDSIKAVICASYLECELNAEVDIQKLLTSTFEEFVNFLKIGGQ